MDFFVEGLLAKKVQAEVAMFDKDLIKIIFVELFKEQGHKSFHHRFFLIKRLHIVFTFSFGSAEIPFRKTQQSQRRRLETASHNGTSRPMSKRLTSFGFTAKSAPRYSKIGDSFLQIVFKLYIHEKNR